VAITIAVMVLVAWVAAREHVSRMDECFFQWSSAGLRGLALYVVGDYRRAASAYREHFERLGEAPPGRLDSRIERAAALSDAGDYGAALEALTLALRDGGPATPAGLILALRTTGALSSRTTGERPHALLAAWYRYLRAYDPSNGRPAIRAAQRAVAASERAADAYLTIGVIRSEEHRRDEALAALLAAVAIDPRHAEALRWTATVYGQRGDLGNEYRMAKAAVEAAPGDMYYVEDFAYLLTDKLGDYRQALSFLERIHAAWPGKPEVLRRLGHVLGFLNDPDRGSRFYEEAIRLDPRDPSLHLGLGWLLYRAGRLDGSIAAYQRAQALAPRDPGAHRLLAASHQRAGRYPDALRELERALQLGERMSGVQEHLCRLYHLTSAFSRARLCLDDLLAREPSNPWGLYLRPHVDRNLRGKTPA